MDRVALERYLAQTQARRTQGGLAAPSLNDRPSAEQIEKQLRDILEALSASVSQIDEIELQIESLEVMPETIALTLLTSVSELKALVGSTPYLWNELVEPQMTFKLNEEQQLEFALFSRPDKRYVKQWLDSSSAMASSLQVKFSFTITMPGKIISSNLTEIKENSSWIAINSWDEKSIVQFREFLRNGIRIVSENGGLLIAGDGLDSVKLNEELQESVEDEEHLPPITEAAPGFIAEVVNSYTIRTHQFAEAEALFGSEIYQYLNETDQTVINGRLFAPKKSYILQATDIKILSAKDDHNRDLPLSEPSIQAPSFQYYLNPNKKSFYIDYNIPLPPPPLDSRAVEEMHLEAIVTTYASWEKMEIKLFDSKLNETIDLSTILPGAKLTILSNEKDKNEEIEYEEEQNRLSLNTLNFEITGPPEINRLSYAVTGDGHPFDTRMEEKQPSKNEDISILKAKMNYTCWDCTVEQKNRPSLIIKLPTELKRQRVTFTLTAIDLY